MSDGFVFPLDVMARGEAEEYRRRFEAIETRHADRLPVRRYLHYDPHYLLPVADELMRHPGMLAIAGAVLGPDLMVCNVNVFLKEPASPDFVSWHQDLHYAGLDGLDYLTVWLALTPATVENGCMRYLPGSHRHRFEHRDTFDENNMLTRGQVIEPAVDESRAVNVLLDAGQAAVHHGRMCHASRPNPSRARRMGFAVRYIAPGMRQTVSEHDYAVLVQGEDRHGHFHFPPPPIEDFEPARLAGYEKIMAHRRSFLYHGADEGRARRLRG